MTEPASYAYLGPVSAGDLDGIRAVAATGAEINGAISTAPAKHASFSWMGESMYSAQFPATLTKVGASASTISEEAE